MAYEVIMPRVDMDMVEGKIAYWYVKNGDRVSKGQPLFDIETDKATMEVEADTDGVVQGIHGEIGVMMPVGTVVAWLLAQGETLPGETETADAPTVQSHSKPVLSREEDQSPTAHNGETETHADTSAPNNEALLRATPLARSLARAQQIDIGQIQGSGPNGRILARDLPRVSAPGADRPFSNNSTPLNAHWLTEGRGTPLVLLHGFGADHGSWKPFVAHIPSQPALAVDLPNHGKSAVENIMSLQDLAQRVLQALESHGVRNFHLMGHSLGGAVALALAKLVSARLQSITLIAPAGLGPDINGDFIEGLCRAESEAALRPWMAELVSDASVLTGSFIATAHRQLASSQKRQALRSMAHNLMPFGTQAESLRHVLDELQAPAKVIWGSDDRIIPVRHGSNLPGQIGLHVLRGVGHLPYIERPQLVAKLVTQQMRH